MPSKVTKLICSGLENAGTIMYDLTTKSLSFRDGSIPPLKGASNFKSFKYQNSLVFLQESIVEQVPNSRNFITARTCSGKCSVEVVDAALEKQVLYFEKTLGGKTSFRKSKCIYILNSFIAIDDVATSTSRGMMAFNSIKDEVSYHLVNAGDLNILRRVKWNLQHAGNLSQVFRYHLSKLQLISKVLISVLMDQGSLPLIELAIVSFLKLIVQRRFSQNNTKEMVIEYISLSFN